MLRSIAYGSDSGPVIGPTTWLLALPRQLPLAHLRQEPPSEIEAPDGEGQDRNQG